MQFYQHLTNEEIRNVYLILSNYSFCIIKLSHYVTYIIQLEQLFLHGPVEKISTQFRITYLNTLISKVKNVHAKLNIKL